MQIRRLGISLLLGGLAFRVMAAEPEWNPARFQPCDRACLVDILDGYMNGIFPHNPKLVPLLALDVRMTENTGHRNVGEGMLWAPPDAPAGMMQNLGTMETFGIRGGLIHEVEAFPFDTIPYGLGDDWTEGSGR